MKNIGSIDRILRFSVGIILLVLGAKPELIGVSGALPIAFIFIGVIMLLTAVFSFCPLYPLIGVNTCEFKKK